MLKPQDDYTTLIATLEDFILLVYTIIDDPLLGPYKYESPAKFQQEFFNLHYKRPFQIAFQVRLVFGNPQKLKHIGIADNIGWLCDFNSLLSQRENLFFVGVAAG